MLRSNPCGLRVTGASLSSRGSPVIEEDREAIAVLGKIFSVYMGELFPDLISIFTRNSPAVILQNFTQGGKIRKAIAPGFNP